MREVDVVDEHEPVAWNDAAVPGGDSARNKAPNDDDRLVFAHRILQRVEQEVIEWHRFESLVNG